MPCIKNFKMLNVITPKSSCKNPAPKTIWNRNQFPQNSNPSKCKKSKLRRVISKKFIILDWCLKKVILRLNMRLD